jgi:hypothetical protein
MKTAARRASAMVAVLGLLSACSGGDATGSGGDDGGSGGTGGTGGGTPFDRSNISFVDNLLAKVEDGEWTLGEGLVATLQLFEGERDTDSVLRHPELLDYEGTGIIAMAYEYLEDGPDDGAKEEINGLLRLLVFSSEQLEAMAGLEQPGQLSKGAVTGSEEDCRVFWEDYEIPAGIGQCLQVESTTIGGKLYRVFFPAPSLPSAGWTNAHHARAMEAIMETVPRLNALGTTPPVAMVFAAKKHAIASRRISSRSACLGTASSWRRGGRQGLGSPGRGRYASPRDLRTASTGAESQR